MLTREEIKGQWNQVKGRLQEHWGQLTEDDLRQAAGSTDRLIGVVQQKTGATRREVERLIEDALTDGRSAAQQISEVASQYAQNASEVAREHYEKAADATADFSKQVAQTVKNRPAESLAIVFGLGVAAGALFFMSRRRR